jgi:hypothetical protein
MGAVARDVVRSHNQQFGFDLEGHTEPWYDCIK